MVSLVICSSDLRSFSPSLLKIVWILFRYRDYLSPINLIETYPHLVVLGTGLAFGFLVVSIYFLVTIIPKSCNSKGVYVFLFLREE